MLASTPQSQTVQCSEKLQQIRERHVRRYKPQSYKMLKFMNIQLEKDNKCEWSRRHNKAPSLK